LIDGSTPSAPIDQQRPGPAVQSQVLLRSTWLNVLGQIVPLAIGAASLPIVVRGLGVEQFGLLSVSWAILAYFTIFDLGLAPATTKYLAEAVALGDEHEGVVVVSAALAAQAALGVVGSLIFLLLIPVLTERVLNVPPDLLGETNTMLAWLALGMPIVLLSSSLNSVLQGVHRFDLINAVRIPSAASTYLAPAVGVLLGLQLSGITIVILAARLLALIVLALLCLRVMPGLKRPSITRAAGVRLFRFGLWQTATNVAGTLLWNSDRFLIGALVSASAVGYYTVPAEVVGRLAILPSSLVMALFPAFSALDGVRDRRRLQNLFVRSVKFSVLVFGPPMLLPALFADEFLHIWMGPEFAAQSALLLRVLTISSLLSFVAYIPLNMLRGIGFPDVAAKCYTVEFFVYATLAVLLTSTMGVTGTAIAWCARALLDAVLMFYWAISLGAIPHRSFWISSGVLSSLLALIVLAASCFFFRSDAIDLAPGVQWGGLAASFAVFGFIAWRHLMDAVDRQAVFDFIKIARGLASAARRRAHAV
jgi:O-antigen/teichoic acid export membrane protein